VLLIRFEGTPQSLEAVCFGGHLCQQLADGEALTIYVGRD
jgi:hypothetical protein